MKKRNVWKSEIRKNTLTLSHGFIHYLICMSGRVWRLPCCSINETIDKVKFHERKSGKSFIIKKDDILFLSKLGFTEVEIVNNYPKSEFSEYDEDENSFNFNNEGADDGEAIQLT